MGLFSKLFNLKKEKEVQSPFDYNLIFDNKIVDNVPVDLIEIGLLNVPTGHIVVCDPLVYPETLPFTKIVPPGKYPVTIYVAKTENSGDRYAIAKLQFKNERADKWVLALQDGQDVSDFKDSNDYYGFPVDAGLGGFFDVAAGIEYNKFLDQMLLEHPDHNIYDDFFANEFKKNAKDPNEDGDWINFTLPNTELNITMFHSGYGDGVYPSYWGMKNNGDIVSLVIDFQVFFEPEV